MIKMKDYGEIIPFLDPSDYREFTSKEEVYKWGSQHYDEWSKKYKSTMNITKSVLTESDMVSNTLECYCGFTYKYINKYLRFGEDQSQSLLYRDMAHILLVTIASAPKTVENIVVYRNVCDDFIRELVDKNKNGIPICEKGFMSTSLLSSIYEDFEPYSSRGNLLKIYVPKGSIGVYVNSVTRRNEQELLFLPNGYLRMNRAPYRIKERTVYECGLFYFNIIS